MSGKAAKIRLTEKQQHELQLIQRSTTCASRLVLRATIILLAWEGMLNMQISKTLKLGRQQIGLRRWRWQQSQDALLSIECSETRAELRQWIQDVLSDAPRSGPPGKFTAAQVTEIIATACEAPKLSGRPVDNWTHRELTDEISHRNIVHSISEIHVGNLLRRIDLQQHKSSYWLNTKEKDAALFRQQVEHVCQTYLEAPTLFFEQNTRTISVDEMCGIQALERIAPTIGM